MAGRKIRDEVDARRCLRTVAAAGGDTVGWSREHGVDARSLRAWRMNLDRRGTGRSQALQVVELVTATPAQASVARYVLSVGDVAVEFDDACSGETLARVVRALPG
jgi:hypothetical protein